jgi:2,5-diketo-D-gluconate reductase A
MTGKIPELTLNTSTRMPALGFGVYQVPADETERVVTDALEAGYRHLDTAAAYENEAAVGRAIAASGIPRGELFVTTKLWVQDAGESTARDAFGRSLDRLGLDYLDLYLIHQPYGDYYGSWRAMQSLHGEGLARAIGTSNFYPDRLVDLIDHNETVPAVNQIEAHPFFQRGADLDVMRERGVQMTAWGPLGQGRADLFEHPVLVGIAETHGKTVAQVSLRWLLQRGIVVIPKTVSPERMRENLSVFDFDLTDEQMMAIASLDTGASTAFDHHDPAGVTALGTIRFDT